jgi:hypothetical protein
MVDHSDPNLAYTRIPSGPAPRDGMPTHQLVIDHAGNWIFKPIRPLTQAQRPAPPPQPPEAPAPRPLHRRPRRICAPCLRLSRSFNFRPKCGPIGLAKRHHHLCRTMGC